MLYEVITTGRGLRANGHHVDFLSKINSRESVGLVMIRFVITSYSIHYTKLYDYCLNHLLALYTSRLCVQLLRPLLHFWFILYRLGHLRRYGVGISNRLQSD